MAILTKHHVRVTSSCENGLCGGAGAGRLLQRELIERVVRVVRGHLLPQEFPTPEHCESSETLGLAIGEHRRRPAWLSDGQQLGAEVVAGRADGHVDGSPPLRVRAVVAPAIHGPRALVHVRVRLHDEVDVVAVEQRLDGVEAARQARLQAGRVERAVSEDDDPRHVAPVGVGALQVSLEPGQLRRVVVVALRTDHLRVDGDHVNHPDVDAVPSPAGWHRPRHGGNGEAGAEVRKPGGCLVVTGDHHVGDGRCQWLDGRQERVPNQAVVAV